MFVLRNGADPSQVPCEGKLLECLEKFLSISVFDRLHDKHSSTKPRGNKSLSAMQRIEIDVLAGLPVVTHSGNRYILVATDMYTKYMQTWSMASQTAQKTAFVLYHN